MAKLSFSRQFLRRRDDPHRMKCAAIVECRGIARNIEIVDFSNAEMRLDRVTGLVAGDYVRIALTPELAVEGTISWAVWYKAGFKLIRPLAESDPAYVYLAEQAAEVEHARERAVLALAEQHCEEARQLDTD